MKNSVQIISKGLYKGENDLSLPVIVKEYIFVRNNGKKALTLRFENVSHVHISKMSFYLVQKNFDGIEIGTIKISLDNLKCRPKEIFSPNACIFVNEKCSDFEIRMISIESGAYSYKSRDGERYVRYLTKPKWSYRHSNGIEFYQRVKTDSKVKFTMAILILAVFLFFFALIWPFFVEEICPLIAKAIGVFFRTIFNAIAAFFRLIGRAFNR